MKSHVLCTERQFNGMTAMIADIAKNKQKIIDLCKQYEVIRLGLFGSAARGDFDPERSDLDFLALFDRRDNPDYTTRYFGLVDDLEALFGRGIDLVTEYQVQSPWFREAVERDLEMIYDRADKATAA
jgi:predicted nucleotidyltransferase